MYIGRCSLAHDGLSGEIEPVVCVVPQSPQDCELNGEVIVDRCQQPRNVGVLPGRLSNRVAEVRFAIGPGLKVCSVVGPAGVCAIAGFAIETP